MRFVDVEEAMTDGETLDEALFNASEALSGILGWMLDENQPIPDPSPAGDGMALAAHGRINHLFRPHRHRMAARDYRATRARAFDAWQQGDVRPDRRLTAVTAPIYGFKVPSARQLDNTALGQHRVLALE